MTASVLASSAGSCSTKPSVPASSRPEAKNFTATATAAMALLPGTDRTAPRGTSRGVGVWRCGGSGHGRTGWCDGAAATTSGGCPSARAFGDGGAVPRAPRARAACAAPADADLKVLHSITLDTMRCKLANRQVHLLEAVISQRTCPQELCREFTRYLCTWIIHTILTYLKMLMAVRV